MSDNLLRFLFM